MAIPKEAMSAEPEASFKTILPEDVDWMPFAAFPPSVRLAVLVGQPSEPGPYTIRVKVPGGVKLMPHRHPEDRVYTVISGVFYIGVGDEFDAAKLEAYPSGAVIFLPGNTSHFHWAKAGEYITQVTAIGPLGLEYVNSKDDPRGDKNPRGEGQIEGGSGMERVSAGNKLSEGEMRVFDVDGTKVAVAAAGGQLYAFDDACTHMGCSLGEGKLENTTVTCPCHGSQFDVSSGAVIRGPAQRPVRSRSVQTEGDDLLIES